MLQLWFDVMFGEIPASSTATLPTLLPVCCHLSRAVTNSSGLLMQLQNHPAETDIQVVALHLEEILFVLFV